MHLLTVLQSQTTNILDSILAEVMYEEITEVAEGRYRNHQLATVYCSHMIDEFLQEFAAVTIEPNGPLLGCPSISFRGRHFMHFLTG
jgi:hypothetical protein